MYTTENDGSISLTCFASSQPVILSSRLMAECLFSIRRNLGPDSRVCSKSLEIFPMPSSARIFFAGVGTTFAILAVGFGGGILMANSTFSGPSAQKQAVSEPPAAVRIVHPNSAEPAVPAAASARTEPAHAPSPELATQAAAVPSVPTPPPSPTLAASPSENQSRVQSQVEDQPKSTPVMRANRRQRYAERRARRHQHRLEFPAPREPRIMAFDGDPPPRGFFGN